jgi:hypothetical protein
MQRRTTSDVLRWPTILTVLSGLALGILDLTMGSSGAGAEEKAASAGGLYPFERGFPSKQAAQRAHDDADYDRAVTAYRFWYPTVSAEGSFAGARKAGLEDNQTFTILAAKPHHVVLTANSDTPYGSATLDLTNGPMVVELPKGSFIGLAMDHNQGWIQDMGLPGADAGKGGKHLIVMRDYKGEIPSGYYVGRSPTLKVWVAVRALPANGDTAAALASLRSVKIYPFATAKAPVSAKVVDVSDKPLDLTALSWEDNIQYWQKLHEVIAYEPMLREFEPMYGVLKALGIDKGKPFAPDARMKRILERAANDARGQMLVSAFASERPDRMVWKGRTWEWAALTSMQDFQTPTGLDLEARERWMVQAIVNSPAMFSRSPGAGSLYWLGLKDNTGAYLDGAKTYKLSMPLPVPSRLFWSVTVYDAETRSQIQTDQARAALRSLFELKDTTGSSAELYFGPKAPVSKGPWIKTTPGKGWFAYLRIYGPEAPAFDGTWKPGDFEEVKLPKKREEISRRTP